MPVIPMNFPSTVSRCMEQLRWRVPSGTTTKPAVLQQAWECIDYEGGKPVGRREEWKDVPTVVED